MKKIAVAMSGGVDSSVAALLLKEAGHEITGVTMCLGAAVAEQERVKCCGFREMEDAKRVCRTLGIRHFAIDFSSDLEEKVIGPFVAEYLGGRTPNPCVACNRWLKFGSLLGKTMAWGFDALATGHYAAIENAVGGYRLKRPREQKKDQTYFLYAIPREVLPKIRFPLAGYTKEDVRGIAKQAGLPVFEKKESQDICFVPAEGLDAFLRGRGLKIESGEIVDRDGRILGRHKGIACYTIGQRGGLGLSVRAPLYVLAIDGPRNRLVVGGKEDLRTDRLVANQVNRLVDSFPGEAWAKIRYAHRAGRCRVFEKAGGRIEIRFAEQQEAVTPGQSVVLYDEDVVLGGGIIQEECIGSNR